MLFINTGQLENKLDAKLKKQEIVFDTAVFHYELTYDNKGFVEYTKALESRCISEIFTNQPDFVMLITFRKESSMPIRAGVFFEMFPFCLLFEVSSMSYFLIYLCNNKQLTSSLERHDCEEHGKCSPLLYTPNGWKKNG